MKINLAALRTVALALIVTAVPCSAVGQSSSKVWRVGYLSLATPTGPQAAFRTAFVSGLRDLGYVEGQNVILEYRFAGGHADKLHELAGELARARVNVLVGEGIQASLALKQATISIPTVTLSCDAVAAGLVASLVRPGGNITGVTCITPELAAKRLQLLKEIAPTISRVGILWNAADPAKASELATAQSAADSLNLRANAFDVRAAEDFEKAFVAMRQQRIDGLFTLGDSFTILHRSVIVQQAATSRLPGMYPFKEFVVAGGLVCYGPNLPAMFRQLATYVDKIFKGARPGDLPIEQPTKFDFVINRGTAKALGLTIPESVLIAATEVIE